MGDLFKVKNLREPLQKTVSYTFKELLYAIIILKNTIFGRHFEQAFLTKRGGDLLLKTTYFI